MADLGASATSGTEVSSSVSAEVSSNTSSSKEATSTSEVSNSNVNSDELIRDKIRAELEADKTREIDKRVSEAIKKRDKKYKEEQSERDRMAKLSEDERIKELNSQREIELQEKFKELTCKELKLDLVDVLAEEGLPLEFRDIIDVNKYVDVEAENRLSELKKDITVFKDTFNKIIDGKVKDIKNEYLKGGTPTDVSRVATPVSNYDKAKRNGDVKGMISAKLYGDK